MTMLESLLANLTTPVILFFFLGLLAVVVKSDLEIPPAIAKFLSLYLLFGIGFKGGLEIAHAGFDLSALRVFAACLVMSFLIPILVYPVLRRALNPYDAGAVAASYGSVSAIAFTATVAFLESRHIAFSGYMVATMALMESPAIISGLILIRRGGAAKPVSERPAAVLEHDPIPVTNGFSFRGLSRLMDRHTLHEAVFNGSVFLLLGALFIGLLAGPKEVEALKPFTHDIFKGMLCLFMLDMGLLAGRRMQDIKNSGSFLILFAVLFPVVGGVVGLAISWMLGLRAGDALLLTVLSASASNIAVPAAMHMAVPEVNMGILLPMTLGISFTLVVSLGIPVFGAIVQRLWQA
jgi:hypothetical protein